MIIEVLRMSELLPIIANIHFDLTISNILKQYELKLITCEECKAAIYKLSMMQDKFNANL